MYHFNDLVKLRDTRISTNLCLSLILVMSLLLWLLYLESVFIICKFYFFA